MNIDIQTTADGIVVATTDAPVTSLWAKFDLEFSYSREHGYELRALPVRGSHIIQPTNMNQEPVEQDEVDGSFVLSTYAQIPATAMFSNAHDLVFIDKDLSMEIQRALSEGLERLSQEFLDELG